MFAALPLLEASDRGWPLEGQNATRKNGLNRMDAERGLTVGTTLGEFKESVFYLDGILSSRGWKSLFVDKTTKSVMLVR